MSVYGVGPEAGTIEFLYNVTGLGTHALSRLEVGDSMDIVGPLGNTFVLEAGCQRILVVARGVGLATMAPCCSTLRALVSRSPRSCRRGRRRISCKTSSCAA